MTDQTIQGVVDLRKYIETRFFGKRPHIRNKRIPVALIARRMQANGWTITETAYDFSLSESEVLAALLYYEEHLSEINRQEAEEDAHFNEMKRLHSTD